MVFPSGSSAIHLGASRKPYSSGIVSGSTGGNGSTTVQLGAISPPWTETSISWGDNHSPDVDASGIAAGVGRQVWRPRFDASSTSWLEGRIVGGNHHSAIVDAARSATGTYSSDKGSEGKRAQDGANAVL